MFLIKHWKFIAGGIAVLSLLGAFLWYGHNQYHKGAKNERAACEAEKQAIKDAIEARDAEIRDLKKRARDETQTLERGTIVDLLCEHGWVRDPDQCKDR